MTHLILMAPKHLNDKPAIKRYKIAAFPTQHKKWETYSQAREKKGRFQTICIERL